MFGNRLTRTVGNTVEKYVLDGWNPAKPAPVGNENYDVWADLDGNNNVKEAYLRGDVVDEFFAKQGDADAWYLTNRQGSVTELQL